MSYAVLSQGNNPSSYLTRYQINSEDELSGVPKFPDCAYGSTVLCLSNQKIYRLGTDNVYHTFSGGGGGGGNNDDNFNVANRDDIDSLF